MRLIPTILLLLPLVSGCSVYESAKAVKTLSDIDKKEAKIDEELAEEQKGIDRVSREIEELKKDTSN
ncbi:MAG: hypothetical protein GTO40_08800 [Deltaproteobacteria bacterium]|nr:hypothetical protein [Deltaproteobacteria bacterium]